MIRERNKRKGSAKRSGAEKKEPSSFPEWKKPKSRKKGTVLRISPGKEKKGGAGESLTASEKGICLAQRQRGI